MREIFSSMALNSCKTKSLHGAIGNKCSILPSLKTLTKPTLRQEEAFIFYSLPRIKNNSNYTQKKIKNYYVWTSKLSPSYQQVFVQFCPPWSNYCFLKTVNCVDNIYERLIKVEWFNSKDHASDIVNFRMWKSPHQIVQSSNRLLELEWQKMRHHLHRNYPLNVTNYVCNKFALTYALTSDRPRLKSEWNSFYFHLFHIFTATKLSLGCSMWDLLVELAFSRMFFVSFIVL